MDVEKNEQTFTRVSKALGWSTMKEISMAVTAIYLSRGRSFDEAAHEHASQLIKSKEGFTSPLRSHLHHIVTAYFVLGDKPLEQALAELNLNQQALLEVGFWKSLHTYLGGLMMGEPSEAERTRQLYIAMKADHPFLTSSEDIPYAVLLGRREGEVAERAETMNRYYKELRPHGFSPGNHLQWLSQAMTFDSASFQPEVAGRVLAIRDFLTSENIKIRSDHYPVIGFLAIAKADGAALGAIVELVRSLEQSKTFRWYKQWALPFAVQLVMAEAAEFQDSGAAIFASSVEMLVQAQQAAALVSMNAAIAASNNLGS